jgi:RNA polymerase sigma-70 factor (ECF subfamily)
LPIGRSWARGPLRGLSAFNRTFRVSVASTEATSAQSASVSSDRSAQRTDTVDELLGAVAERLLKALREIRPRTVREFFALANQHMRWELNVLARRLDNQLAAVELCEELVPSPASSVSGLTPDGLRMLRAIDELPEDEQEVFDLVRIQGMTQAEAAELLGVSAVTVKRRLSRGLRLLAERLADLRPGEDPPDSI